MKLFITLALTLLFFQSKSQSSEKIDTILKSIKNDYLVAKGLNLYSNQEMDFWRFYSEPLFSNPEFQIINSPFKNLKGIVNLKARLILLPFDYDDIDNSLDSAIFTSKNKLKGIYFPFENKNILANNQKVNFIKKNRNYFTLRNDSLFFYNKIGQIVNIFENIQNYIFYEEQNKIEIESSQKFGLLDIEGKSIIPAIYSSISNLTNGNFILGTKNGYGIYRKGDLKKLTLQYFSSYSMQSNTIIGFENDFSYFFTEIGTLLNKLEGRIEVIPINEEGFFFYKARNLLGIVNSKGKIIKKPFLQDKKIEFQNYEYFEGKVNGKWKFFNYQGVELKSPNLKPIIDNDK